MTAWSVDRAVDEIARRQYGVLADRQARRAGASTRVIGRRLATGRWVRLDHHVYALPSHPGTWHRQCMAAVLTVPGAGVSHETAAALHGLSGFRPGRIHLVVAPTSKHVTALATVHRSAWPRFVLVDRIRSVTMADTFFQLLGQVEELRFRTAFEDAVAVRAQLLPQLLDRYVDLAHRRLPGIRRMRALLHTYADGEAPPLNELERRLDQLLDRVPGLPCREHQAPLPGWERGDARVDILIHDWRLIVEADGRRWHTRVDDFDRDRWRDNVATAHGYDVLRFTYNQLVHGPDESLALLLHYADARRAA